MKTRLAKYARPKAIGLFLDEQEVTLSVVATTLLGAVEITSRTERFAPDRLEETLQELLRPWIGRRHRVRLPVAVGLPASRVFFATRSLRRQDDAVSSQAMFQRMLVSPTTNIDDFTVELRKSSRGRDPTVSSAACRRKYLIGILASLEACGVRPFRVEPSPCALVRAAVFQQRGPRKAKTILRILLGRDEGLIVLTAANHPIAWRSFPIMPGAEPGTILCADQMLGALRTEGAILCAARTLGMLRTQYGVDSPIDAAIVHGRPDLHTRLSEESFVTQMGFPVMCCEHPALTSPSVAFGLALGCLQSSAEAFDLAQSLKPRASLWEIFPWGELVLQGSLLVCMSLLLVNRSNSLRDACEQAEAEIAKHPCVAAAAVSDLRKERQDLQERVAAVERFLSSRVLWTSYTRDLPDRLPANVTLGSMYGLAELATFDKGKQTNKPSRSFLLQAAVPIRADGSLPLEIDTFLNSLRGHPLRDFPVVALGDIKWSQRPGSPPMASFTVIALSKTKP